VFTPFVQGVTAYWGVGLGLGRAISKRVVEAHGGRLELASDGPGRSCSFRVTLVVALAPPAAATGSTDHEPVRAVSWLKVGP
jgi:signal transduction histidine kinase